MLGPPVLLRCGSRGPGGLEPFAQALRESGDENVFNPSMAVHDGAEHVVYRCYGPGRSRPFRAVLLSRDVAGGAWRRTDLTARAQAAGVPVVADPKLVPLGGELWVTFNSGFSDTQNELYLMRLLPEPGQPQRCVLQGRQPVEKNWGFVAGPGGPVVLYGLGPLVLLHLESGDLGAGDLRFAAAAGTAPVPGPRLALGSQPVVRGDDLLVVAHEKLWLRGRRGYFGRPVTVRGALGPRPRVDVGRTRMIHSLAALRPRGPRHNPHLLFATYFSGLALEGGTARLGYGTNDRGFGFAEVRTDLLWP